MSVASSSGIGFALVLLLTWTVFRMSEYSAAIPEINFPLLKIMCVIMVVLSGLVFVI
jgi:heme/copper-type cytochrome/quinol oxidase subunit 4